MRLCSIASGSSGNCIYVGSEEAHVLVDVGISGKSIEKGLNSLDLTGKDVDGILITHEHSDHIKGLGVISRKYGIPIYTTGGTADAMLRMKSLGKMPEGLAHAALRRHRRSARRRVRRGMRIRHAVGRRKRLHLHPSFQRPRSCHGPRHHCHGNRERAAAR